MNLRENFKVLLNFVIFVIIIATALPVANADGVIGFETKYVAVQEKQYALATFNLRRESGTTGIVYFFCEIANSSATADFVSVTDAETFADGANSSSCTFTVQEDSIPEANETFTVQIVIRSGATIGPDNTAYLTILSNDDPYGIIQFQNANERIPVQEPLQSQQSVATFNVIRRKGTFGTSIVYWQANNGMGTEIQDFSPSSGFITFQNGESVKQLNVSVLSDKVPENNEQFTIELINATGGAVINASANQAYLDIPANEPPIRFLTPVQTVSENQTLNVTVTRGSIDGVLIGTTNIISTVNYTTVDGSARAGTDYQAASGLLSFSRGEINKRISVVIQHDLSPELAENFTILLSSPSAGSVLVSPSMLTVVIQKNDDPHGVISFANQGQIVADEDSQTVGTLEVNRLRGTFGTVSVAWSAVASSRSLGLIPNQVLNATSGTVTFNSGASKGYIYISARQDMIPEEAAEFNIQLFAPSGGAKLEPGMSQRTLLVQDSDNAYGAVLLGNASENKVDLLSVPRRVLVPIRRTGGALASVRVNYTVVYLLPGSSIPSNDIEFFFPGFITIANGSFNSTIEISISESSFLRSDGAFLVTLLSTRIEKQTIIEPKSPILGNPRSTFVNITSAMANGEISFFGNPVSLNVNEPPDGLISNISLLVMRDGVSGPATVTWRVIPVTSTFTLADASPWNGTIYFQPGVDRVNLTLSIYPDNIPEVDEVFTVELTNVTERNERIRTGASRANVAILQNDDAGGIFEFSSTTSKIMMEGSVSSVDVVRLNGALTTQRVLIEILGGQDDFVSYRDVLTFFPTIRRSTFNIFTINDVIPEAIENFTMTLTSIGDTVLGRRTSLFIIIPQNDDANGVFSFTNTSTNLNKYADEVRGSAQTVSFEIQRQKGTYSSVSVFWNVTSLNGTNASLDIETLNGVVHFSEGQNTRPLIIRIKSDIIPEGEERFQIQLINITGGGRLVQPLMATLIVNPNDAPIHFLYPLQVEVIEGQTANLTISLNRTLSHNVTVFFSTIGGTAMASAGDYVAAINESVVFRSGEKQKTIHIPTIDDVIPEIAEEFIVRLQSSTGDTIIIPPSDARVIINANDDPYGVFQFSQDSLSRVASEGNTLQFNVIRSRGTFGSVTVSWEILSSGRTALQDNGDFVKAKGGLTFPNGSSRETLSVVVRIDLVPELNETFYLRLTNVTGNFAVPKGGYLGNRTEATIVVLPNDDPFGVIEFASSSSQVSVAEDYLPGFIKATYANLTVDRKQGTLGSTKVVWQLYKATNVLGEIWDLIFYGQRGSDVVEGVGRNNSGTPSVSFNSSNASYIYVSPVNQPPSTNIQDGFSISLWMKPKRNSTGTLIAKRDSSNNAIIYQLSIDSSAGRPHFIFQVDTKINNISAPSSLNLFDGAWHSLVLTIGRDASNVYLDATVSGVLSLSSSVSTNAGYIYLGCSLPALDHYVGALQDVRIYSLSLPSLDVNAISSTIKSLRPVNGYLTYGPGVSERHIFMQTMDNSVPEVERSYSVKLISLTGDGRLGTTTTSRVTILKSDNANGQFGFMQSNCQLQANESDSRISFAVSRTGATFGSVQINWEIREIGGARNLASTDFRAATGSVTFAQGDGQKSIEIIPLDDSFPELAEHFELRLISAISTDGTVSSTPTSGASIRFGANTCNITLLSSDNPYGVFQIAGSRPTGTGIIPKMNQPENIHVAEEAGGVTLFIVRAQGIQGSVTCEWRANSITARGNFDFTAGIGSVSFQSGENISSIGINITDNKVPELAKLFNVQLYNPTGGAVLGAASYINITIMPSDDAYGVFSFANASMNTTAAEGSSAVLSVVRMAGSLGTVRVSWMLINGSSDFSLQNGSVLFTSAQTTSQISIPVIDDAMPELMESFKIRLTSVSNGRLASRNIEAIIRIVSNDDPYGTFEIAPPSLRVQERNQSLQLTISRRGGSLGFVRVSYQTFVPSTSVRYATPSVDFVAVSDTVDFIEGQIEATINVTVIGDDIPEADEYFMVNLTAVRLVGAYEIVANSPKLGSNVVTEIIIEANDDANGVLQLSSSAVVVTEGTSGNFLNITRRRGTFGQVSVRFTITITDKNTVLGVDYQISTYLVQLIDGQTSAYVPVQIVDDNQPEFNESFIIRLEESSLTGGAKLGTPKECVVTILENDYPYGLIGFASGSLNVTVMEPATGTSSVRLTVMRSGGTSGIAQIEWSATLAGQLVLNDVTPSSGNVQFLSAQSSQDIELFVNADNIPEDSMSITVLLGRVVSGKAVINTATRSATINIPANDDPYGVVQFNQSSIFVEERDVDYFIHIPIKRTRGLFGTIQVFYSTRNPSSGVTRAQSGADFEAAVEKSTIMGPGVSFANASIKILKDNIPELEESFLVEITRAEAVGLPSGSNNVRLSEPRTVNVTIRANDQPYGLLGVYMKNTGGNGTYYAIIEPESGTTTITFEVRRDQGSLGTVSVSWRVSSSSSVNISSDVSGVSGATLTFSSGENSKEFIVQVHSDTIPESDEYLIIELYDARGGAVISASSQRATLVIMANDGVGGRIGFRSGSRSQTIAEGQNASLLLYRTAPAAGIVSLNWTIEGMNASRDFVQTSGVLLIPQGTTMVTLLLQTLNDSIPENHETFTVRLSAPFTTGISSTGAAILVPGDSTATIVIGASDEPHGIIEFAPQPQPIRVAENVGAVNLRLVRIMGNIGNILVHYQLGGIRISQTTTEGKYGEDFNSTVNNTIVIRDGSDSATIRVNIIDDNIPEQDEAFFVNITSVALIGASNLTTPPKIGSSTYMQIIIQANDGTQGELAFAPKFERIKVSEDIGSFNVTVIRYKGTFGNVYAFYYLNRLTASPSDFNIPGGVMAGGPARLSFADGEKERNITVIINNDNITETDEQFEIGLTIQNAVGNGGVQIGKPDKALVTIAANDDANGVIRFSAASSTQYITEAGSGPSSNNTGTFFVERLIGLFGLVNVQWRVLGVTNTSDVTPISGLVVFQPNVREQFFQISAVADNVPELRKEYTVQLSMVSGGARLSTPSTATLVIAANGDPHGLLSVRAFPSMVSALNVEESTKFIRAVVRRRGGSIGEISVQYYTTAASAAASSGSSIQFGFDQVLKTISAEKFHAFKAYGKDYLLLASSYMKVAVGNKITSSISNEPYQSTLFRWQGTFVPILNITTDGGVKWSSFEAQNNTYIFAVNHGTTGRYETMSQLMRLHQNETLELMQNIATKGGTDVRFFQSDGSQYMIVINMKDNSGNSVQRSQVFRWQGSQFILESASIETKGGSSVAVCAINGVVYVAVANNYDSSRNSYSTDSLVYSWSSVNRRLDTVQSIRTNGASDVDCTKVGTEYYLVFATAREPSRIFRFNPSSPPSFVQVQTLASGNSGKFFKWNYTDYLVIASNRTILYKWNNSTNSFSNVTEIPISNARDIQPFSVHDPVAGEMQYLATTVTSSSESYLLRATMLSENSDFVPRRGLLSFFQGQTSLSLDLTILSDSRPEMDESFSVELASPTGGSTLAPSPNLAVTILSNDNAYGRLAFVDSALNVRVTELQWSSVLRLDVVREFGSFGQISLSWNVSSLDGSAVNDLYPTQGQINLNQGVSSGSIFINIRPDGIPELDENFVVRLTSVSIAGAIAPNRGPTINHLKSTSSVTILANDDPYGVVGWKNLIEVTTEEKEVNSSAMLIIRREFGKLADIRVDYETKEAINVSQSERVAIPGIDYFTKRSFVLMKKDEGEAIVYIKVRHDNITNVNEVFKVEITNVTLMTGTRVPNSPRIDRNRRQAEVIITEVALNRGTVHFEAPFFQRVSESVGVLSLNLVRSNGSEGSVGVQFNVEARNASSNDYSPQSDLVTFSSNVTRAQLNITIVDDNIAELDESFVVRLTKPFGGVTIGSQNEVTVVIIQNDYPYGLLSFNSASRTITNVMEGQSVRLTVDRNQGLYSTIRVDWSCGNAAQSDLTPWSGTLVFAENATQASIDIRIINDTTPELSETFTCMLSNPQNGAAISPYNNASITVLPSDKPYGIISVQSSSRQLVVAEPSSGYDGTFSVSILRSVGFDGLVSVHWKLNALSGVDDSNTTFNVTSGVLSFASGVAHQIIYLQVLDDATPEESKKYQVYLERTSGGAELDVPTNTKSEITVAASDNPYGIVQFARPLTFNVSESVGTVNLSLTRTGGTIGQLSVMFSTSSSTSTPAMDFTPANGAIIFNPGDGAKILSFNIIDDLIPELAESFVVNITSVSVITSKTLNYGTVNGIQVDVPPRIGSQSVAKVTINANDKPYGEIGFLQSRRLVHESDGIVSIPVNRTGGTFGTSTVTYTYTDGTAQNPSDYTVTGSRLTFVPGDTQKFIEVQLIDDRISEFQENFRLDLTSVSGPAALGSITRINITIETSDNPYGLFGIYNTSLSVSVANPNVSRMISFPVYRKDGALSTSQVSWRILRNVASASLVTEDITPASGSLTFNANERGPKLININIRPAGGPQEPEEQFTLQLFQVTGGATLDQSFANVMITVLKKGYPSGLFRLSGTVSPSMVITEPQSGMQQIDIPVQREFGSTGSVLVSWAIRSFSGSADADFAAFNTSLLFASGEASKNIRISLLADSIPEVDEIFELSLVSASNGGEINTARSKINFTVSANDYPHGRFILNQTNKRFEFSPSTSARLLHFTIARTQGAIGSVLLNVDVRYSFDGSIEPHVVNFTNGQNELSTTLNIAFTKFLEYGSNISISLRSASIIGIGSSMPPSIMSSSSSVVITIPEAAANSILEFSTSTRYPLASATYLVSNIQISRRGLFGSVSASWRSGYPPGGFTIGSIVPSQGTVNFNQGERTKSVSFQVQIPSVLQNQLIYAIYLSSSTPAQGQTGWPKIGTSNVAVADPHGVIEIAPNSLNKTVVEGNMAVIEVRRLLSTIGTIRIAYSTQKYIGSNAATEGVDFTAVSSTFDMANGQSSATINVHTLEDSTAVAEKDEYFNVVLTSVQALSSRLSDSSPRLSANNRMTVTIRDNDTPFGVISFSAQSLKVSVEESIGYVVLQLVRAGGVFSRSTVLVRSVGGGESWQNEIISGLSASSPIRKALTDRTQAASANSPGQDYTPINQEVVFEEMNEIPSGGQIKTVNITISRDAISEPAEQLIVVISNVTGGASLPIASNPLKGFSVVTINGNGLWNGEIGFTQNIANINEDGSAQVVLPLERRRGSSQSIEVRWQIWSTIGNIASQFIAVSGTASFAAGNSTSSVMINLRKDQSPEFASWFFVNLSTTANGAVISNGNAGLFSACNVTILESDYPAGRIGFSDSYRFPVVTTIDTLKDIRVRRYNGTLKSVTVMYRTTQLATSFLVGDVVMTPAREYQDYTPVSGQLSFPVGRTEEYINIQLTPNKASSSAYPKVFNISLMTPTNGAILYDSRKSDQVIIAKDSTSAVFLKLRSSVLRTPLTDIEIDNVFTEMLRLAKLPPIDDMNQALMMKTIRLILSYKAALPPGQRALSNSTKALLLDVYDSLLSPSRTDTLGKSNWAILLDEIAYSFLNDVSCPHTFKGTKTNFALTAKRESQQNLNGIKFTTGTNGDFFRYPVNMFSSTGTVSCKDIHFIDYGNKQLFSSTKTVLNNKVLSSKIKSGIPSGMKVVYRIHASKERVAQVGRSCVIWKHPAGGVKGDWVSTSCQLRGKSTTYVECECQHLSEYAVIALSDNRTGYDIYFLVSCYIVIGACFLALVTHHLSSFETTFTAGLLMHFFFAIMMSNILFVVGAYISPELSRKTTEPSECGILGISIHYFFLAQFTTVFAQGCNLWRIFIVNDEHTDRKYLHFYVIGWGSPIIVIAGYVLATYTAYRWPFSTMYGDVNANGDMCFMSNIYAALGSVIFPAILLSLGVVVVLVQSYYVKHQWKCYDDIYRDRYNYKEMRHIIAIFALLCIAWLLAGLHLAYGYLWMIIAFSVFNIILGLYILILYAVFRNQMRFFCHASKSSPSSIAEHELVYTPQSLTRSSRKLVETQSNRLSDWEDVELPMGVNPMDIPDNVRIIDSPDFGRERGRGKINESYDIESDEFDDLIFALKTGGRLTPVEPEEQELEGKGASPRPVSADQPQVRRIKIADTHL